MNRWMIYNFIGEVRDFLRRREREFAFDGRYIDREEGVWYIIIGE